MKKILFTYIPASMLLAFLAMVLFTCGGGGGGGGESPATFDNGTAVAWQPNMLSISTWFEENIDEEGGYHSHLYIFGGGSSFKQYSYQNPPDTSDYVTGTWSIDASGNLILAVPGQGTITVTLFNDPFISAQVLVDDGTGTPYNTTWKWTGPGPYPFDESLIPGTYVNQFGDTWIFNANGTGSTTGDGGWTYTWSVDNDGILKVIFPNGYVGSMYERPGSQGSDTSYTIIEWAFVLNTPTGEFGSYYGGMELTRQGGEPPPGSTLTGLSIDGGSSISEYSTDTYTATAHWSDNSKSTVTPTWSVNSQMASISPYGVFSCQEEIASDQMVTITATYSSGGITKTATVDVTIENFARILPIPPFDHFNTLSGIFFDERVDAEGKYESSLYMFHEDFSFEQYIYENPPDTSNYVTGTWSINSSGEAILNYNSGKTITWKLLDPWIITWISVDDGTGTPSIMDLEITGPGPFPFDSSFIHGTYVNQYGDTWVFNSNGTGSTTSDGGSTFTWFVDDGLLKIVFPNGYVGWMYEPASSRPTMSPTILRFAILKYTPTGDFSSYEGGMQLTPQ